MTCEYSPRICNIDSRGDIECSLLRNRVCAKRNHVSDSTTCVCANSNCFVCPAGSYGQHRLKMVTDSCKSCPPFSTSYFGNTTTPADCICMAGYTFNETSQRCEVCPTGTYKSQPGNYPCTVCKPGFKTHFEASTSCDCMPGYTQDQEGNCEPCPINSYKDHSGPLSCKPCPMYSTTEADSGRDSINSCVCVFGTFVQVTNPRYGECQEYPNQELIEQGLMTPPSTQSEINSAEQESSDEANKNDWEYVVHWIAGVVGAVVGGVCFIVIVVILIRKRKSGKSENPLYEETQSMTSAFELQQSVDNVYISFLAPKYFIHQKNITLGALLGQGAFGQVFEAYLSNHNGNQTPLKVAVKKLRANASIEEQEALKTELEQMLYVGHHPNIVNLLGASFKNGRLMIVMEYAEPGNLLNYLKKKRHDVEMESIDGRKSPSHHEKSRTYSLMKDNELISIIWQIAKGMRHLGSVKCIHRDLAARNILLADNMVAKISDFGLAREVYENGYYFKVTKGRLPFKWMSPESLLSGQYTTKSDVWSFGVLLWEIATLGGSPYPGIPVEQIFEMLKSGYRMSRPDYCDEEIYTIMLQCWRAEPADRPNFGELVEKFDRILQLTSNELYLDLEYNSDFLEENGMYGSFTVVPDYPSISEVTGDAETV
ncbi:fibroblast growth factor receptor 3-like [Tubulanus polymorphus]|uniref:fibroblast growth factor receptor 3-like n=1 Tax=Tubulanus polymorphus TaxID=672921 RepID=UPI003DA23591